MNTCPPGGTPAVTVDLVVLTLRDDRLQVLLIERGKEPFRGRPALPGGFLDGEEDLVDAAIRELAEETAVDLGRVDLEQLGAYGGPRRDPRGHVVTVAYLALGRDLPRPVAGSDAGQARWAPVDPLLSPEAADWLAFDHRQILADAVERTRVRLEYTTAATALCGAEFTLAELRQVYEACWGAAVVPGPFQRAVLGAGGFVVPVGRQRPAGVSPPADLYRRGDARRLRVPLLRAEHAPGARPAG